MAVIIELENESVSNFKRISKPLLKLEPGMGLVLPKMLLNLIKIQKLLGVFYSVELWILPATKKFKNDLDM